MVLFEGGEDMSDLISRQAAIEALCRECSGESTPCDPFLCSEVIAIQKLPSTEPERPKGEWIHIRDEEDGNALYECSVCHKGEVHVPIVEVSYCWNCGADMRGGADANCD